MNGLSSSNFIILCHTGTGSYSKKRENVFKDLCKKACEASKRILTENFNRIDKIILIKAAEAGMKFLENSGLTNAGYGSNLNMDGFVECEAGIMEGQTMKFGGIGAVSHLPNPIEGASALLIQQIQSPLLPFGRYPPSVLVGGGAEKFAKLHGADFVSDADKMILEKSRIKYNKYQQICNIETSSDTLKRQYSLISNSNSLDTVGLIICYPEVGIVACCSSGGIFLKYPGRLGQSCCYGGGCYAREIINVNNDKIQVAAVTTGLGEQLTRTLLARSICEEFLLSNDGDNEPDDVEPGNIEEFLQRRFMQSQELSFDNELRTLGVLAVKLQAIKPTDDTSKSMLLIDVLYAHSPPALCFGILQGSINQSDADKFEAVLSRRNNINGQNQSEFTSSYIGYSININ